MSCGCMGVDGLEVIENGHASQSQKQEASTVFWSGGEWEGEKEYVTLPPQGSRDAPGDPVQHATSAEGETMNKANKMLLLGVVVGAAAAMVYYRGMTAQG